MNRGGQNKIGLQSFNPMSSAGVGSPAAMTEAQNSLNLGRRGNQSNVGEFVLGSSQRNPTPLFGRGPGSTPSWTECPRTPPR